VTSVRLKTGADDAGRRLDRILRKALPDCSLSFIHRLLRQGKIRVDGGTVKPETRVPADAVIEIATSEKTRLRPGSSPMGNRLEPGGLRVPAALPEILARGSGVVFFNKPAGLASHGPGSLDAIVKARYAERPSGSLSFRPGPLHRLDRPTSGVVAFSESLAGAKLFTELLRERRVTKTYLAILEGRLASAEPLWRDELARDETARKTFVAGSADSGKFAETGVRALACNGSHTLVEANIVTGRTHQIRSQAAARGNPLAGDVKYGGRPEPDGFFLHAWKLEFHAEVACLPRIVVAPPPPGFAERARSLFGDRDGRSLAKIFS